jgi:microcystin-dependent protein
MALQIPTYMEEKGYTANNDRWLLQTLLHQGGIVNTGDFFVTSAGGLSVNVAAGFLNIKGTSSTYQGSYLVNNNAAVTVPMTATTAGAVAAPGAGLFRLDQLYVRIKDNAVDGGGVNAAEFFIVPGTSSLSTNTLVNRTGASATVPTSAVRIADVLVGNSSLTTGAPINSNNLAAGGIAGGAPAYADLNVVPLGGMLPFGGSTAPYHYLLCDGAAVSRTNFSGLFTVIGTTYGVGNGTTTFNVPNLQDRIAVGKGVLAGSDVLGETGGAASVALATANMPAHSHGGGTGATTVDHQHLRGYNPVPAGTGTAVNLYGPTFTVVSGAPQGGDNGINGGAGVTSHGHTIAAEGSGTAHENMPPYITLNYIIRAL